MLNWLIEKILPYIIGFVVHKHEKLTRKEDTAQEAFMGTLPNIVSRKTEKPIIVAMIGIVGSGKTSVAKALAERIGATVIEGDKIRVELRRQDENYERARAIAENVALEITERGGNVILDSDFIDPKKRASLREKARKAGVPVAFVCVYAEYDVMVGRIITANYRNRADDFFGGAPSKWQGDERLQGAIVKLRELWRRTPLHYKWDEKVGGQWTIKNPPCPVIADIDTTDPGIWKAEVSKLARKIIDNY